MQRLPPIDREGQHVGGGGLAANACVQLRDPLGVDELDRQVSVADARRGSREQAQPPDLGRLRQAGAPGAQTEHLDLEHRAQEPASEPAAGVRWECTS